VVNLHFFFFFFRASPPLDPGFHPHPRQPHQPPKNAKTVRWHTVCPAHFDFKGPRFLWCVGPLFHARIMSVRSADFPPSPSPCDSDTLLPPPRTLLPPRRRPPGQKGGGNFLLWSRPFSFGRSAYRSATNTLFSVRSPAGNITVGWKAGGW